MRQAIWLTCLLLLSSALSLAVACGDDDDGGGEDRREIEETIRRLSATGPEDIDYFLDHVTDNFLEDFSGFSREECREPENVEECVGEPSEDARIENVALDGDRAEADATFIDGEEEFSLRLALIREDGVWKVDAFSSPIVEIPEGVTAIDVTAVEYEFQFEAVAIEDGNIAFRMTNEGEEPHELVVARINEDFDIDALLEAAEEEEESGEEQLPPGVEEFLEGGTFAQPGDSSNVVFEEPLDPSRHLMICFVETEDGEFHASLGMYSEFEVPE